MKRPRASAPSTQPRMIGRFLLPPFPLCEAEAVADEPVSDAAAADPDPVVADDVPTADAEGKTELRARKDDVVDGFEKSDAPRSEAPLLTPVDAEAAASDSDAAASEDEAAAALAAACTEPTAEVTSL